MLRFAALALTCAAVPALAQSPEELPGDGALRVLVEESLGARAELAQLVARARAARERVPQAQAWPEPMLQVGVQNDGFSRWQVGSMGTSWVSFMASQTLPFPGKLGLRGELAQSDARLSELEIERVRLSTIAEVRRGYLALQLVRERKELLERLISLSGQLVEVARIRFESGTAAQSDVLRARVELSRVTQRRYLLEAEERVQTQALNRLRKRPLDTEIGTASRMSALAMPDLLPEERYLALARERSPEWLSSLVTSTRAGSSTALAKRSYFPDVSVSAGIMLRGQLEPMWALSVGVPLPVFAASRQARAVAEAEAEVDAAGRGIEVVEQLLALRARQRAQSMTALQAVWRNYQDGLLLQAATAAESTMAQYVAGRAEFAAVLEANAVSIAEWDAAFQVLANAWLLIIAQDELSPTAGDGGSLAVPRAGAASSTPTSSGM